MPTRGKKILRTADENIENMKEMVFENRQLER